MLLGGNINQQKTYPDGFEEQYIRDVEFCGDMLIRYKYEEAWTLMSALKQESIPLLFHRALCLYEIGKYGACIDALNQILTLLSALRKNTPHLPSEEREKLHEVQKNQVTYLNPVTFRYVELFPDYLKESVLRLTVDCWSALGNSAKVIEIGTPLKCKGYRNVIEALEKAK